MAESPSVYSARSELSPQGNDDAVAEVLGEVVGENPETPLRRTRLFEGHGEEQSSTSSPLSPRYLTRSTTASESLIEEDTVEDDNEEGDGDSMASAAEMDDIEAAMSTRSRLQVLIKIEDDTDEVVLDDPCYKHDCVMKCLVHNLKAKSEDAELDLCDLHSQSLQNTWDS